MSPLNPPTSRPETPPHHPIFGISLPIPCIEGTIAAILPHEKLLYINQLSSGKSFNNRIYFLAVERSRLSTPAPVQVQELVLKVNGRFFGPEKIQNEVSCLKILAKCCADLPVPRVVAWSEDGQTVTIPSGPSIDSHATRRIELASADDGGGAQQPGWILMTRFPGELADLPSMGGAAMVSVGAQLAEMVASWRFHVPATYHCGNLLFRSGFSADDTSDADFDFNRGNAVSKDVSDTLVVRGLLGDGIPPSGPIRSVVELHQVRLQSKLHELQTSSTYAPSRALVPLISEFITESLPKLFEPDDNTLP